MLKSRPENPITPPEQKLYSRRSIILRAFAGTSFLLLGWRLFDLQVLNRQYYAKMSKGNRIRLFSVEALRGLIYDRNGKVLAKNIPSYDLTITLEDSPDPQKMLRKISKIMEIKPEVLEKRMNERKTSVFIPRVICPDLDWRSVSIFMGYREEFPGIGIEYRSIREFLYPEQNAHILGYLGYINEDQLKFYSKGRNSSARILGQEGLEKELNDYLIGYDGGRQSEVDNLGRVIKVMDSIDPIPGSSAHLTIDNRLQTFAYQSLQQKKGAIIITRPETGEVLNMVSSPSFDPNLFSKGIKDKDWSSLLNNPDKVLNNRAIQGRYSPGSTFKVLIALAALNEGILDENRIIDCPGYYRTAGRNFNCWKKSGHGKLKLVEALEQSCNVFFYKMAKELGADKIHEYAKLFGFGEVSGLELADEVKGTLPYPEWKKKYFKETWQPGDTINYGIGQGFLTVTPIELINYLNRVLTRGKISPPYLVDRIEPPDIRDFNRPDFPKLKQYIRKPEISRIDLQPEFYDLVMQGMKQVIQGKKGTARSANSPRISIAGKTGTTQVIGQRTKQRILTEKEEIPQKFRDHAWFMGYAPAENPQISLVVFLENGEKGSNAARVGRSMIEYYSSKIQNLSPSV